MKEKILYLLLSYGGAGIQFLILPFFVSALGVDGFGKYSYYFAILNWFCFFSTLGSQTKVRKVFSKISLGEGDADILILELNATLNTVFFLVFVNLLVLFLSFYFFENIGFFEILLLGGYVCTYSFYSIYISFLISNNKAVKSAVCSLLVTSFPMFFVVLSSQFFSVNWILRIVLCAFFMFFLIFINRKSFFIFIDIFSVKKKDILNSLKESIQIAPNGLYDKVLSQGDKVFVGMYFGLNTLAVYALGSQLCNILYMTMKSLTVFTETKIFKGTEDVRKSIKHIFILGCVCVCVMYFFLINFASYFFSKDLYEVNDILLFQLLIVFFRILSGINFTMDYSAGLKSLKRNVCVQYFFLLFFVGLFLIFGFSNVMEFCVALLGVVFFTFVTNFIIGCIDRRHRC